MKSLKVPIYNLFFYFTIIGVYFIHNNRYDPTIDLVRKAIVGSFAGLFLVVLVTKAILGQISVSRDNLYYSILIITISIAAYFNSGYVIVNSVFIITALYIVNREDKIDLIIKKRVGVAIFISVLLQMLFFRAYGRPVLSYIDPNYSSMYIMLAFMFSWKIGQKKIAIALIALGMLMLSRNFLLSIIIFFIFLNSKKLKNLTIKIPFSVLFFLSYLALLIIGAVFIQTIDMSKAIENHSTTQDSSTRLTEYADMSNFNRFTANALFLKDLKDNPIEYLWGMNIKKYTNTVFKNTPHNFLFLLIVGHGILFSITYLIMLFKVFSAGIYSYNNIPYILSFMPYVLFLGGGFSGVTLLFLIFILKTKNNISKYNKPIY